MYDVCVFSASRHCFTCVPYHMLVRLSISLDIRPYKEEPMPDADRPIKLKVEPDTQSPALPNWTYNNVIWIKHIILAAECFINSD